MKRNLALLLAMVMALSLLPMNAFAANNVALQGGVLRGMDEGVVVFEGNEDEVPPNTMRRQYLTVNFVADREGIIRTGFDIVLTEARWAFNRLNATDSAKDADDVFNAIEAVHTTGEVVADIEFSSVTNFAPAALGRTSATAFAVTESYWFPMDEVDDNVRRGTFVRIGTNDSPVGSVTDSTFSFSMQVINDTTARVTILGGPSDGIGLLRVPLVYETTGDNNDITARIQNMTGAVNSHAGILLSSGVTGRTNGTFANVTQSGRDEITLADLPFGKFWPVLSIRHLATSSGLPLPTALSLSKPRCLR
ncbi:MAG: hypothetical protein FWE68_04875 [Defluviitaleaceae bacterium]|nr:hypothetical protein [Defluviitaleaceae bacterium]